MTFPASLPDNRDDESFETCSVLELEVVLTKLGCGVVETPMGGVGVGAGVAIGEPVPREFKETIPGDWTLTVRLSAAMPLGSPPMLTDIWK